MQVDLEDYVLGAAVATDLVNTAPEVMARHGEALAGPDELATFLANHGLRPDAVAGRRLPTRAQVAQVHDLRTAVRAVMATAADGDDAVATAAAVLAARGHGRLELARDDSGQLRWVVRSGPDVGLDGELALLIGIGLLAVVRALGHERFRDCASVTCAGTFVDSSRAGRRRYCMPELCGNRVNVAKHRARRSQGG
ncbi:CGNR zinc finger domain-containing protein [Amycolatopsis suaedae]|uniref:Zf-CGNR multi-domain protein n=1 Tax=Amycolatopsis suaedae TaxID=2510978 RepID=A0A4Q7JBL4_9PSEU|nr:CGNR zinc finger domain-containing protein [Amycolatopsis suaedae]RZQ63883.1 zf-CGNR multi-domain protein [Amycolatopsis suaedae]